LHISRVMVSAYCRASFVAPLFVKSIFSTMVDTSGMGVGACATEDCRKGSRTFQWNSRVARLGVSNPSPRSHRKHIHDSAEAMKKHAHNRV